MKKPKKDKLRPKKKNCWLDPHAFQKLQTFTIDNQKTDEDIGIPHKPSGAVWKSMTYASYLSRMNKALDAFDVPKGAKVVADVGCGPWGGIFFVRKWAKMYGIDPVWNFYQQNGLVKLWDLVDFPSVPNIENLRCFHPIEAFAQIFKLPEPADIIFSINAINHCGTLEKSIENIVSNLRLGGTFLLHVHLRTPEELEPGHPMAISEEEIRTILGEYNTKRLEILTYDPTRGMDNKKTAIAEVTR